MRYTPQTWANSPSTSTPISAARLTHMESGLLSSAIPALPNAAAVESLNTTATVSTVANSFTVTIASGILAADMTDFPDRIGMIGTTMTNMAEPASFFFGPGWKEDYTTGAFGTTITTSWAADIWVSGTRYVEFVIGRLDLSNGIAASYRVWVDGQRMTDLPQTTGLGTYGQPSTIKVDFGAGSTGTHRVKLEMFGIALSSIHTEPAGTVWAATPTGPRLFVLGPSLDQGTVPETHTGGELGAWFPRFCNLVGIQDYWNGSEGGTGPFTDTPSGEYNDYITRVPTMVVPADPDIVIISTYVNDLGVGRTGAQISADIASTIDAIHGSALGPIPVIVIGGIDSDADPTAIANLSAIDLLVEAECIERGAAFVSGANGRIVGFDGTLLLDESQPWITTGNLGTYISALDDFHPTDAGQAYVAYRMRQVWKLIWGLDEETGGNAVVADLAVAPGFVGVTSALQHNRSTTMSVYGDSTGDATAEWFSLLGQSVGDYFDANVLWRKWNDTNQSYDPPTSLATSTQGERAATLSSASLQYAGTAVTGDIEIIAKVKPTAWNSSQTILSRYETTGNQRGFQFNLTASGRVQFIWSANGTSAAATIQSVDVVPFANGTAGWVRMTFDVDNGASGNTATFYSSTDGTTWSALGAAVVTATATSIFASTTPYQIGSYGASITTPFAGDVMWVQLRNALSNGTDQIPPLPDTWNQVSSSASNTVQWAGGPALLLLCGSQSGQGISYLDNATRRPKLIAPQGQDVIFLNTGHNDTGSGLEYTTTYSAWVTNIKSGRPNVPIIVLTENPTKTGSTITNVNMGQIRAARTAALATWAAAQSGVSVFDTHAAFTDLGSQIDADGLHPTPAGSAAWASWLLKRLFPDAAV